MLVEGDRLERAADGRQAEVGRVRLRDLGTEEGLLARGLSGARNQARDPVGNGRDRVDDRVVTVGLGSGAHRGLWRNSWSTHSRWHSRWIRCTPRTLVELLEHTLTMAFTEPGRFS